MIGVKELLIDILGKLKNGELKATKAVIVLLDDTEVCYDTVVCNAKLRPSEIVALLSVAKHQYQNDLAFGED